MTFTICVRDFPRGEVSVKVGIMEFGLGREVCRQWADVFCWYWSLCWVTEWQC